MMYSLLLAILAVAPLVVAIDPVSIASLWNTQPTEQSYYSSVSLVLREEIGVACSIITATSSKLSCVNITTGALLWTDALQPQCVFARFVISTKDQVVVACDSGAKIYPFAASYSAGTWVPWPSQIRAIAPAPNQYLRVHDDYVLITVENSTTAVGGLLLLDAPHATILSPQPFLCSNINSRLNVVYGIYDQGTVATMCSEEGFFALSVPNLQPTWFLSLAGFNAVAGLQLNVTDFFNPDPLNLYLILATYVAYVDGATLTVALVNPYTGHMDKHDMPLPTALRGCLSLNQLFVMNDGSVTIQSSCGVVNLRNYTVASQLPLNGMIVTAMPLLRGDALLLATDTIVLMFNVSTGTIEWLQFVSIAQPSYFGIVPLVRGVFNYGDSAPSQGMFMPVLITLVDSGTTTAVWMLDMDSGNVVGHYSLPYLIRNSPVFVRGQGPNPAQRREGGILLQGAGGMLSLLSTTVGWSMPIGPVFVQDAVVFGASNEDDGAIAVDRTGEVVWSVPTSQGESRGMFVFANNYVVQVHRGGGLTIIDAYSGNTITTLLIPSECQDVQGSIGTVTSDRITRTADGQTAYFVAGTYCMYRLDASLTLTYGNVRSLVDLAPVLDEDNRIAFVKQDAVVMAVNMDTLEPMWSYPLVTTISSIVPSSLVGSPSTYGKGLHKLVYILSGPILFCLNIATSPVTIAWYKFVSARFAPPIVYDNALFVGTDFGIARVDLRTSEKGNIQWNTTTTAVPLTNIMYQPIILPKGEIVVVADDGIVALDTNTGAVLWTVNDAQTRDCSFATFDVKRYLVMAVCLQQLVVIDALQGKVVLRVESDGLGPQVTLSNDVLFLTTTDAVYAYTLPVSLLNYNKGIIPPIRPTEPPSAQTLPPGYTPEPPYTFPPIPTQPTTVGAPLMARRLEMTLVNNVATTSMESQDIFVVALTPSIKGCTPRGYNSSTFEELWSGLTDLFPCNCDVDMQILGNTSIAPVVVVKACGIAVGLDLSSGTKLWTLLTANVMALNQYHATGESQLLVATASHIEGVSIRSGTVRWSVRYSATVGTPVTLTVLYNAMSFSQEDTRAVVAVLNTTALMVVNVSEGFTGTQRLLYTDTTNCDYSTALMSVYPAWGIFPNSQFGASMFLACRAKTSDPSITIYELNMNNGFSMTIWDKVSLAGDVLNLVVQPQAKMLYISTTAGVVKLSTISKTLQWIATPGNWGLSKLQAPLGLFEQTAYVVASSGDAAYFIALDINSGDYRYNLTAAAEATSRTMIIASPATGRLVIGATNAIHYINNNTGAVLWQYAEPSVFHSIVPFYPPQVYGTQNGDGIALLALAKGAATTVAAVLYTPITSVKPDTWSFPSPAKPPLAVDGFDMTAVFDGTALYGITNDGVTQWASTITRDASFVLDMSMGAFSSYLRILVVTPHDLVILDGDSGHILSITTHAQECRFDSFNLMINIFSDASYFYFASQSCFFRVSPLSNSVEAAITTLSIAAESNVVFSRDRSVVVVSTASKALLAFALGGAAIPLWVSVFPENEALLNIYPAAAGATGSNPASEDLVLATSFCQLRGFRMSDGAMVLNIRICTPPTDNIIQFATPTVDGHLLVFVSNVGLFCYRVNVDDPNIVWVTPMNGIPSATVLAMSSAEVVIVSSRAGLMARNMQNGDLMWAIDPGVLYPSCTSEVSPLFEVTSVAGVFSQCDGIIRDSITGLPVMSPASQSKSWVVVQPTRVLWNTFDLHIGAFLVTNSPLFTRLPPPGRPPAVPVVPQYPSIPTNFNPTTPQPTERPVPLAAPAQFSPPRIWSVPGLTDLFSSFAVMGVMNGVEAVVIMRARDQPIDPVTISSYNGVTGSLMSQRIVNVPPQPVVWMGLLTTNIMGFTVGTALHVVDLSNERLVDIQTFDLDRNVMRPTHPRDVVTPIVYVAYYGAACIPQFDGSTSSVQCIGIDKTKTSYNQTIARHVCPGRMQFPIALVASDNIIIVCTPNDPAQPSYVAALSMATGASRWTTTLRQEASAPRATAQYIIVPNYNIDDNATMLTCIDVGNGDIVAQLFTIFSSGASGPADYDVAVVDGNTYWVATTATTTAAYHVPSTVLTWSFSDPSWNRLSVAVTQDPQANMQLVYIGEYDMGLVIALRPDTGALVWNTNAISEGGNWQRALIVVNSGNGLLDPTASGMNYIDLQLRKAVWFYDQITPPIMIPYFYTVTGGAACIVVLGSTEALSLLIGDLGYAIEAEGVVPVYDNSTTAYLVAWSAGRLEQRLVSNGAPQWNVQLNVYGSSNGFSPSVFLRTSPFGADHILTSVGATQFATVAWNSGAVRTQTAFPTCGFLLARNTEYSVSDKIRRLLYTTAGNPCLYIIGGYTGYVNAVNTGHNTALLPTILLTDNCIVVINTGGNIMCVDRSLSESSAEDHPNNELQGSVLWSHQLGAITDQDTVQMLLVGTYIVVSHGPYVYLFDFNGQLGWQKYVGDNCALATVNGLVAAVSGYGFFLVDTNPLIPSSLRLIADLTSQQLLNEEYDPNTPFAPPVVTLNGNIFFGLGSWIFAFSLNTMHLVLSAVVKSPCTNFAYSTVGSLAPQMVLTQCGTVELRDATYGGVVLSLMEPLSTTMTPIIDGKSNVVYYMNEASFVQVLRLPVAYLLARLTTPSTPMPTIPAPTGTLGPSFQPQGVFSGVPTLPHGVTNPDVGCSLVVEAAFERFGQCVQSIQQWMYPSNVVIAVDCAGAAERLNVCSQAWIAATQRTCVGSYVMLNRYLETLNATEVFGLCGHPSRCTVATAMPSMCAAVQAAQPFSQGATLYPSFTFPPPANAVPSYTVAPPATVPAGAYLFVCYVAATRPNTPVPPDFEVLLQVYLGIPNAVVVWYQNLAVHNFSFAFADAGVEATYGTMLAGRIAFNPADVAAALRVTSVNFVTLQPPPAPVEPTSKGAGAGEVIAIIIAVAAVIAFAVIAVKYREQWCSRRWRRAADEVQFTAKDVQEAPSVGELKPLIN